MIKIKKLLNSSFGRSIITLTSGSVIAQLITIIISPMLTRLFSPEQLGIYTLILTVESLFGGVICGRYDVAIVSEPDEKRIFPLLKLSVLISFVFSILASLGFGIFLLSRAKEYSNYTILILFIFLLLLANGFIKSLESYNNRLKEYKVMTTVYVLRTSVQNFGAVVMGFLNCGVFGLLISHTLGLLFGLNRQAKSLKPNIKFVLRTSKNEMKEVLISHRKQPLYSAPAVFANRFSYSSITFFIEALFGLTILGYYSISYKVLGLPLSVLSNNISKVFFQQATEEYNQTGQFLKSFNKTSAFLACIAVPMVLCMMVLVPPLFEPVFGKDWGIAGQYVRYLAPMFGIRFIVNTLASGLQVAKKQEVEFLLQVIFVVMSIICFIISKVLETTISQYLMSITILFSIVYAIYYLIVRRFAKGAQT